MAFFVNNRISRLGLPGLIVVMLGLMIAACTPSIQEGGSASELNPGQNGQNSITVIGQGKAVGQPDEAQITVGIDTFAKDVNEATSENEATIQAILSALGEVGVATEDIQTSNYSLWAEQLYGDNGPEGIAGYRVSNQVNVKIREIDKVGEILNAAINAGANTIYGVNFSVADPAVLEEKAREEAINNALERAQSLAALSGVELGEIQVINEAFTQVPGPMMGYGAGGGDMYSETSISPGQLNYHVQVQVTYAMK